MARFYHAMAYDSRRGRTVLFGGIGIGPLDDTWEWDGSAWTQVATTGPAPRQEHAMAFDSQRALTVLHGGTYSMHYHDTWEWDGLAWRQVADDGPTRFAHAMVYSSQAARTVLFGGGPSTSPQADTWEYSGTGSASVFGSGCGSPPLSLAPVATALPRINTTAQASLTDIPASFAFVALGWSRTTCGPFALPLPLAPFGMPGCELLQSAQVTAVPVVFTGATTADLGMPLPNDTGLVGIHVYLQGWAFAPGANPGHLVVSNGLDWRIGP
jgi:hypothetical protein